MLVDMAVRLNDFMERHRKILGAVTMIAMAVIWAHYARFIRLPEIVVLPVMVTGILTGARFAIWDGWLKKKVDARSQEAQHRVAARAQKDD